MLPVVSIVGRPNVGKSTLFNRLIGKRTAIVHDSSGVTRDRHYGSSFWNGRDFNVIDTGGYVPDDPDTMVSGIREQAHMAIDESDLILFMVDVETGLMPLDREVANILRSVNKPVVVVANKSDNQNRSLHAAEFYELGMNEVFPVSAMNGTGTGELLDYIVKLLPESKKEEVEEHPGIPRLAIVGRPNVGKSSLVNALLNDERTLVTDIAGTTRDSINSLLNFQGREYMLVDTAGLRKRTKVRESVEFYSTVRSHNAIRESDVVILLIDAIQGFEAQDVKVLTEAEKFNKGIIIALNKWDLVDKEEFQSKEFEKAIRARVPSLSYVPIVTISALTRQRIFKILDIVDRVLMERSKQIPTNQLNKIIAQITEEKPLPIKRGHPLKIKYAVQAKANPPVFIFFMNRPEDMPANYRRFIEAKFRELFSFEGVPLTLTFREK